MAYPGTEIARGNTDGLWIVSLTISPSSVANATTAEQTFKLTGLKVGDYCQVSKPSSQGGLGIVNTRVTANDTIGITFSNVTAATITPTSNETYTVQVSRTPNLTSGTPTLIMV